MPPLPFSASSSYPDRHTYTMASSTYHPDGEYSGYAAPPPSPAAADSRLQAVTITLRSTRPTAFQTRNITLRPDEPVNVGRSSKSEAKNLSSTANNALFDCPVISRRHAEFELRLNKWKEEKYQIFIKDTGSMHGTSVNGQKLVSSRPFELKEGDTIRLGESVNRADSEWSCAPTSYHHANTVIDNYDGVTVTLHCISTATKKTTAQVKSSQQGISVPSDSESDFDEDDESDGGADLHPSSAHTTPDTGNVKSVSQPQTGSSRSNVIMVEDDEDDEPVPKFTRRAPAQPNFIPDTYADNSVMAADSLGPPHAADAPHSSLEFSEAYAAIGENIDVQAAMAAAETAPSADEGFDHEEINSDDDDGVMSHGWSDGDHFSEEEQDSDEHSDSHEDFDRQSFLSEEFNMTDDAAVDDDEDDEGPEIMSSKRRPSNELGTLGNEQSAAMSDTTREAAIPARPHYDPVRGFQVSAPDTAYRPYATSFGAPSSDAFADQGHSTKWDVGPAPISGHFDLSNPVFLDSFPPLPADMSTNMPTSMLSGPYDPTPTIYDSYNTYRPIRQYSFAPHDYSSGNGEATHSFPLSEPFSGPTESISKKRKAPEISTSSEPVITAQAPTSDEASETVLPVDAITTPATTTAAASSEPQPKKRKIKQAHSQKSLLRTAVIEAGKYTAGAIIGGIGLVTILASPLGEALASC
jgi:hypothetical protein